MTLLYCRQGMELAVLYEKVLESDTSLRLSDLKQDLRNSVRLWLGAHTWQLQAFSNTLRYSVQDMWGSAQLLQEKWISVPEAEKEEKELWD